ncbi:aminotransferase class I/II-fold pyridoxal phosphate-dependent enzyme [Kocuria sp.]|uniref:aminotransferase class I/II-fold pyridoxal phosphate-dependent enzyme n=1 Tax=Kocuria sp. TaxID=1871328 RepID=UPI0026DBDDE3|nr:aminotransferase class I/II-fold pyridoxal phosphate-dependent enzyme [Kocuria sp.]MDO4918515.1 aminotransferase class I/II-fold pyridoxal phosphate-dependent enzyme [Kocuria sp.]
MTGNAQHLTPTPPAGRPAPWQRMAAGGGLLDPAGRLRSTVFEEMTALARRTGSVNLGQGFPDFDPPQQMVDAAAAALRAGHHQYAPITGVPVLREAVAAHQRSWYGLELDPEEQVVVCAGATEGVTAALLSLLQPGDEVVLFEPRYDLYGAVVEFAGATAVSVPLLPPAFVPDPDDLRAAFSPRTRAVVLNDPHNPTGTVASREFKELLVELAAEHGAVVIADEVYEHLRYDGPHEPLATLPGAAGRTLTVSSAGKTFSATGWRVGWVSGPRELLRGVVAVKTYLSHSAAAPLQHAVAEALTLPREFFDGLLTDYRERRDVLLAGLGAAGLTPPEPRGTFFAVTDVSDHYALAGVDDAAGLAQHWADAAGVVGIPVSAFAGPANRGLYADWLRLAFCKRTEVLRAAMAGLAAAV